MMETTHLPDYSFFGLRLRSPFRLHSLPAWPALGFNGAPEVELYFGETPASLAQPIWASPFVEIASDRTALVNISAVARFWIRGATQAHGATTIAVQPVPGAELSEIETILLGTVAGIVLHLRSLLPLHASCVVLGGRAIALSGPGASGKSALAAALVRRGALLLSDDILVADDSERPVRAMAGTTRARLWPDVMDRFEIPREQRLPTRPGHGKHAVALPAAEARTWPLKFVVRIETTGTENEPVLVRQHGLPALFPFKGLVYQREIGRRLGNATDEFRALTALAGGAPFFALRRTRVLDHLDQCADLVLNEFRGGV
jgi:hypothetical protein